MVCNFSSVLKCGLNGYTLTNMHKTVPFLFQFFKAKFFCTYMRMISIVRFSLSFFLLRKQGERKEEAELMML
jgi:hypothetical protein